MEYRLLIAGFGGQGILTLGKLFAHAGMESGLNVTYYPSYGAEVRGGTANCGVMFSTEEIASPIINKADALLALNQPSLKKYLSRVKENGIILYNESLINDLPKINSGVSLYPVPATTIARNLGIEKATNMVMAGHFFNCFSLLTTTTFLSCIDEVFPLLKQELRELNIQAFNEGLKYESK